MHLQNSIQFLFLKRSSFLENTVVLELADPCQEFFDAEDLSTMTSAFETLCQILDISSGQINLFEFASHYFGIRHVWEKIQV